MIDESKIKDAANNYVGSEPSRDEGSQLSAERASFMDGVLWAQQEFIKTLWHDASEEPKPSVEEMKNVCPHVPCVVQALGGYMVRHWNFEDKCWDDEQCDDYDFDMVSAKRWCYLSDILPKEGGEE